MALLKKPQARKAGGGRKEQRRRGRQPADLLEQLSASDPAVRRWAARDLAAHPGAVQGICARLAVESAVPVRDALLNSLIEIGGEEVVEGLAPLLRSEDAALRNGVIEVLQHMPGDVAPHMRRWLEDDDSDVRIFAIDILQALKHDDTPKWLIEVVESDEHINVIAAAVDRLAEVGTPDMIPTLLALKQRWPGQAFLGFAIDAAVRRIRGG